MNAVHFSSENQTWCTPWAFFKEIDTEFHFDLDAAATERSAKCSNFYTPETDGLSQEWNVPPEKAVFCNPPYGRELKFWVQKAYEEAQKGTKIVLLIPARTDTAYFHDYIYKKANIRFLRGRIKFENELEESKGSAPFPSMLVIYNE